MEKNKTYLDKLMTEKDFREKFDQEYQNLFLTQVENNECRTRNIE